MSVAKLQKLFIGIHKSRERDLLKTLKQYSITEITPYYREKQDNKNINSEFENYIQRIKRALNILNSYKGLLSFVSNAGKVIVSKEEYNKIINNIDVLRIADNILSIDEKLQNIQTHIQQKQALLNSLTIWKHYKGKIEDLGEKEFYKSKLGKITLKKDALDEFELKSKELGFDYELLYSYGHVHYIVIIYHKSNIKRTEEFFEKLSFEEADIYSIKGTIKENIDYIGEEINELNNKKKNILSEARILIEKYEKTLIIMLDYYENMHDIENAIVNGYSTEKVAFYTCWIKKTQCEDFKQNIIQKIQFIIIEEIEADVDESIPIILENKKIFKPFEIVTKMYGVPKYYEIDPTPFLSIFFAMFFGLCLTDAGYGIVLFILGLIFLKRVKDNNFIKLFMISGIFTIFAGAIFNGWFGDLPSYIGLGDVFSKIAILGDPIKSETGSMNFFRLALLLGIIQIFYGMFIKFFDSLNKKQYEEAFYDTLTWIVLIGSLVMLLLASDMAVDMQIVSKPLFSSSISIVLNPLIIISAIIIVLFAARHEKNWGFRLFMGFLNLTIVNGITAYLGDSLSYIRLMALGLVTAGIGVAINEIAFQTLSVPVIGILIMLIIFIFGHLFNLAINVLGAFVHTLRLQYVEFFQKFYEGGGKQFRPLREKHKYVIITDDQ